TDRHRFPATHHWAPSARLHRCAKLFGQAFRSQSELCPQPANADRVRPRKNPTALVRALSSAAPCLGKPRTAARYRLGRETRTPRASTSRTEAKSSKID